MKLPAMKLPVKQLPAMQLPVMKLPDRVLSIIKEYSKPLTHPYWRFGTPHGNIIKNCCYMRQLKNNLREYLDDIPSRINLHINFDAKLISMIRSHCTANEIIQRYGERLIKYIDKKNIITNTNFYAYIKDQLKQTNKIHLIDTCVNDNYYYLYEWQ